MANILWPQALKSCPKFNKLPNLVTLLRKWRKAQAGWEEGLNAMLIRRNLVLSRTRNQCWSFWVPDFTVHYFIGTTYDNNRMLFMEVVIALGWILPVRYGVVLVVWWHYQEQKLLFTLLYKYQATQLNFSSKFCAVNSSPLSFGKKCLWYFFHISKFFW